MQRKKKIVLILALLTLANLLIFFFRNHFQYRSYAGYKTLYGVCDDHCFDQWHQFVEDFPREQMVETKRITDSIINGKTQTEDKILLMGRFIYNRFKTQFGKPVYNELTASPLDDYKRLCNSDAEQMWCMDLSAIFCWFCWSQNIVCRNIEIVNPGNHHILNECYLPDIEKWAMVDLTNNQLVTINSSGQYLDLASFRDSVKTNAELYVLRSVPDSTQKMQLKNEAYIFTYYQKENPMYYYHSLNINHVYTKAGNFKRYFLPVSWYDIFDNKQRTNFLFFIKIGFALLWLISFFVFLFSRTKFRL